MDKDTYFSGLLKMDRLTPDGTFVVPSVINFDIRKAADLATEKGRPLTEEEIKPFLYKIIS